MNLKPFPWPGKIMVIFQSLTPDFFLPDEDLYLEITTLRPKLITKKNRKIRRLRALFLDVKVKMLIRKDLRKMLLKYGLDGHAALFVGTKAQNNRQS
jgi:hypoxanthine phosphoribosyltransferase